jgi:hypothetical protein
MRGEEIERGFIAVSGGVQLWCPHWSSFCNSRLWRFLVLFNLVCVGRFSSGVVVARGFPRFLLRIVL